MHPIHGISHVFQLIMLQVLHVYLLLFKHLCENILLLRQPLDRLLHLFNLIIFGRLTFAQKKRFLLEPLLLFFHLNDLSLQLRRSPLLLLIVGEVGDPPFEALVRLRGL